MSRYVEFVDFGFKNFFRFGSNWVKFTFDQGLINVFGDNGIGKSTLVEAMYYNLFGESYRGINLPKLVNKTNGKGMETYHNLKVHENGTITDYLIVRGIGPKIEKIYINGSDTPTAIPGKFNTYIAEKILGFSSNIYQKVIAVHSKNGSFISMSLDDRRKIIDSIVNLTQTKEYLKVTKTLLSESNTNRTILLSDIEFNKREAEPYKLIINRNKFDKADKINEINNKINECSTELTNISINKNKLESSRQKEVELLQEIQKRETVLKENYAKNNVKALNDEQVRLNSKLMYIKNKAKDLKNEINKIIPNTECSSCGNSYTAEQAEAKRESKNEKYKELVKEGNEINKLISELNAKIEEVRNEYNKIVEVSEEAAPIREKISSIDFSIRLEDQKELVSTRNLVDYRNKLVEIESQVDTDDIAVQDKLKEIEEKGIKLKEQYDDLNEDIESLNYIIKMFSDEGIKALVLKKFLPILNKLINYYLKTFNIPINFEITSDYGYVMSTTDELADDFDGLSGGQQQRINLAILFAQTDLIKIIGNFKTNLLFLDEYVDGAVDKDGLEDTFKILKQITIRDNKSIVVISHRLDDEIIHKFDYFHHATKHDDNFSNLDKVDLSYVLEFKK